MALKMILEKGAQLEKVCADLPRNTIRLLTAIIQRVDYIRRFHQIDPLPPPY
jgi:hypothetical protein